MATSHDITFERGLPASIDAERSILGAVLLDNAHYNEAAEKQLRADDFALDSHRRIFVPHGRHDRCRYRRRHRHPRRRTLQAQRD